MYIIIISIIILLIVVNYVGIKLLLGGLILGHGIYNNKLILDPMPMPMPMQLHNIYSVINSEEININEYLDTEIISEQLSNKERGENMQYEEERDITRQYEIQHEIQHEIQPDKKYDIEITSNVSNLSYAHI